MSLQNILVAIQKNWKTFLSNLLIPLGIIWTILEPLTYFYSNIDLIKDQYKIQILFVILLIGFVYAIIQIIPYKKIEFDIRNRKVIVKFGNIFDSKNTYKVIPVSQFFYEMDVLRFSLQDQLISKFRNSDGSDQGLKKYLENLEKSLEKYNPAIICRNLGNEKLDQQFELGTTIGINFEGDKYLLFSLTKTEIKDLIPSDNCTISRLWQALEIFWEQASIIRDGYSISIPLIGNNVNGINLHPMKTLEINLLAILYALENNKLKINNNEFIEIVIYDKNPDLLEKINLKKVKQIWDNKLID